MRLPWVGVGAVVVATATGAALRLAMLADPATAPYTELSLVRVAPAFVVAAVVGALALDRGNRTGRGLLALGGAFATLVLTEGWAHFGLLRPGPPLALAVAAAWVAHWVWVVVFALLGLVLLRLPDGRLPSPRWRGVLVALAVGAVALTVSAAFAPGPLDDVYGGRPNPVAVPGLDVLGAVGGWVLLGALVACALSLPVRYRRADAVVRQQLKWVMLAGVPALVATVFHATLGQDPAVNGPSRLVGDLLYLAFFLAVGVAVVRHRLFDVDLVLNRALVYGLLAAFVTAVYVAVVIGVGRLVGSGADLVLTVTATVLVALGFAPVREWARRLANRWVYGERQAPYEVLTALGGRLAGALTPDELLPAIAHAAAVGVGAAAAEVRLTLPSDTTASARWPAAPPAALPTPPTTIPPTTISPVALPPAAPPTTAPSGSPPPGQLPRATPQPLVVPVRAGGAEIGRIAVTPRPGFPLTRHHRRLLDDLAQQSAPALSNARLVAELKASRRRLVSVADDERRRLERDLHDGAQAQLVAVTLRLRALAAGLPDGRADAVEQVREQVTGTIATLRDLARGVFPPQLAEAGLGAAVRTHLAKTGSPARLADRVPPGVRGSREVEAALWFCVLEALQNAAKHAGQDVVVELSVDDGALRAEVRDGGPGFDPTATPQGSGLTNMADRMAAVDGTLTIHSAPGAGTRVVVRAPLG
ncbi:MAG TPA: ATP-binding protein [Pseudonocardia sp.]|nr:ATP-binding protein [Pseudonocardia sp.]